jgi:hypothetical protein
LKEKIYTKSNKVIKEKQMLTLEKLLDIPELATLPTVTTKILQEIEDNKCRHS